MGSRKRQDLLRKLGAWRPWKRVEVEGRGKKGSREKCRAEQKSIKKNNNNNNKRIQCYMLPQVLAQ